MSRDDFERRGIADVSTGGRQTRFGENRSGGLESDGSPCPSPSTAPVAVNQILFLCTGNYYRSRYAEIVFNHLAPAYGLVWQATSRGLAPDDRNPGPISQHTLAALRSAGIPAPNPLRFPMPVTETDLSGAQFVVAVKEAEHRPLLERSFPGAVGRVEFWHVHDLDCAGPESALPQLRIHVEELMARLVDPSEIRREPMVVPRSA